MTVSMDTQCLLTNLSLVFVSTIKRAFQKPEIKVKKFPVNEIKMYNGTPQIKQTGKEFIIYFRSCEVTFIFFLPRIHSGSTIRPWSC